MTDDSSKPPGKTWVIGVPLFDKVTLLDFGGLVQICYFVPAVKVQLTSETGGLVTCSEGVQVKAPASFKDCPKFNVLFVPGGGGIAGALGNKTYLRFLKDRSTDLEWVTSVCNGSLLLAAAGLLDGYEAITHWAWLDCLRMFTKVKVPTNYYARYHRDRNRITGGGISSSLDEALYLVEALTNDPAAVKKTQLINQYAPAPPYHDGLPDQADPAVFKQVEGGMAGLVDETKKAISNLPT